MAKIIFSEYFLMASLKKIEVLKGFKSDKKSRHPMDLLIRSETRGYIDTDDLSRDILS